MLINTYTFCPYGMDEGSTSTISVPSVQYIVLFKGKEDVFCQYLLIYSNGLGTLAKLFLLLCKFHRCRLICSFIWRHLNKMSSTSSISLTYSSLLMIIVHSLWTQFKMASIKLFVCDVKRSWNVHQCEQIRVNESGKRKEMGKLILLIGA